MKLIYFFLIIVMFIFSSCSLLKLNEDLEELDKLVTIKGEVVLNTVLIDNNTSIVIVMMKEENSYLKTVEYIHKKHAGAFTFTQEPGKYHIYAWEDINNNGKHENNEAVSKCFIELKLKDIATKECHITITHKAKGAQLQAINHIKNTMIDSIALTHNLGTITSLEDSKFNELNASKGLWEPNSFLETIPSGLFLLEKYNPEKKVTLFIHGINGSPQNFKRIIKSLVTTNNQVMLFYYPSGLRLEETANYLDYLIQEFQIKYQLNNISIIAHSMGGLVAKKYINLQIKNDTNVVSDLITISTPWSGHNGAKLGLEYAPDVIPVWNDMAPNSLFLQNLFKIDSTEDINHYLLFGYKGSSLLISENSDGVVTLESQLRPEAQSGAYLLKGFNEGHLSILRNSELIKFVNTTLNRQR